ncbi:MAG: tRNA (N(6)-L-threonylcarbamoyladenosine(37)-C(2))-methylthiotransferase MtaB [Treponema sp.]|jgi:threonylcarbamoyladenosine tRNA methylthiotransferase MtaB|nr:tRNA (N(6)-L-threonylcarbamoyladenosine(37)-C(2))-methylthiotransferase MtaB [Treponema sp.]
MFLSVYTLGCKLNQLETEAISDSFRKNGFTIIPFSKIEQQDEEPGIIVINTCTVTSMAEQKARRVIRKTLKERKLACVIVTGCYAQMERAALDALEEAPESAGRLFIVPGEKKDRLLDMAAYLSGATGAAEETAAGVTRDAASDLPCLIASWLDGGFTEERDGTFRFAPESFSSHSRGFIKIQDGCDRSCAYCRVSIARGKSRSLGADEVLGRLEALEEKGYSEAVLTGVNISQYRDPATMELPGLLRLLLKGTTAIRLRLSSIEPDMITDELLQVLENDRIRPHFHLSLQSGSAEVLAKMGRNYTPADAAKKAALLRMARNDPFMACDIIVGFPGETEDEFSKSFALCEEMNFAWIHAFPFSPRPGTAAFNFSGKVNEKEKTERVERLNKLAVRGRREYIRRWEGKEVEAVVEKGERLPKGLAAGVSENYLKIRVNYGDDTLPLPGSLIRCRIKNIHVNSNFDATAEKTG